MKNPKYQVNIFKFNCLIYNDSEAFSDLNQGYGLVRFQTSGLD